MHASNSNQNNHLTLALILGLTAIFWLYTNWSITNLSASYVCSNGYINCQIISSDSAWFQLVNLDYYSIFNWRINLIIQSIFRDYDFHLLAIIFALLFLISSTCWFNSKINFISSFFYALFLTIFILSLYGLDLVIFQSIILLPLILLAIEKVISLNSKTYNLVAGFISGLILVHSSNQFALVICLSILVYIYYITDRTEDNDNFLNLVIGLLIPTILVLFDIPKIEISNLPNQPIAAPLYTEYAPYNLINREFIRHSFGRISLIFFILTSLIFVYLKTIQIKPNLWPIAIIFFTCLIDSIAPEYLSQLGPLEAMQKLLPSMFFSPLIPLVFLLGILFLFKTVITYNSYFAKIVLSIFCISILYFGPRFTFKAPYLVSNNFVKDLASLEKCPLTEQLMKGSAKVWSKHYKTLPCLAPNKIKLISLRDIVQEATSTEANPKKLDKLMDKNLKTSWRTKEKMTSASSIKIEFKSHLKLLGLVIDLGKHPEQQPHSYKIEYFDNCNNSATNIQSKAFHEFRPGVTVTNEGYFYENNRIISIMSKEPLNVKCLRISPQNIGSTVWSIAEISALLAE